MERASFRRMLTVVALAGMAALATTTAYAKPASGWRITFNHTAENDGAIVFRIAPVEGGAPIDVETRIPAKTSENSVADLVRDSLKATLGSQNYRVGVDDGESVIVKKRGKTKKFEVTLVSNSLTGLEINIKRE
jgi:hypothetical protein